MAIERFYRGHLKISTDFVQTTPIPKRQFFRNARKITPSLLPQLQQAKIAEKIIITSNQTKLPIFLVPLPGKLIFSTKLEWYAAE